MTLTGVHASVKATYLSGVRAIRIGCTTRTFTIVDISILERIWTQSNLINRHMKRLSQFQGAILKMDNKFFSTLVMSPVITRAYNINLCVVIA